MKEWKNSVHIISQIPYNEARSSSLLNRERCESEKSICLGFNAPSVEKAFRVLSELSGGCAMLAQAMVWLYATGIWGLVAISEKESRSPGSRHELHGIPSETTESLPGLR